MKFRYFSRIITILTRVAPLCALSLLLLGTAFSAQADNKRTFRVLVLYWDNKDFPGNIKFDESFQAALRSSSSGNLEYYPEYIETSRFPGQDQAFFRDYLRQKYTGREMDVVVANADPPLNFLIKYRADLFPNAPIIFVSNQPPGSDVLAAGPGMTGIVNQSTHAPTLDLALNLQPDTRHVFIISGSREHDKRFETAAREELGRFESRVDLNYLTDLPLNELSSRLASLPPKSIAFYIWQQTTDEQGRLLETYEVLSRIASRASAPIYGMGSGNLGLGIIGGYLQGPENNGAKVATMALRIMGGTRVQDMRLENAPTLAMFDWRQLRRWGINEKDLPPGSVIRFREVSFWELYKWYIIGLISAVIVEAILIAWLLFLRRRRRQAELENERLAREAEAQHKKLDEVVSNVPGLVWETRLQPENGASKTTFISDYVEQMLGYTAEEWMSKPPGFGASLIPDEEERKREKQDHNQVLQTGKDGFTEFRWRAKDGRILWVESYLNPVFDEDHKIVGLRGVTLDVSERKSAEEHFSKAFRANPQPMSITTIEDGRYVDVNDSFLSMSGYSRAEVIGHSSLELGVWGSPQKRQEFITELLEHGSFVNCETRFHTKSGKARILLSSAELLNLGGEKCVLMASSDVTERVHIQEALRESEQRFRNMAETAPVMIWVADRDKMCTYFNQRGLDFFGLTMEQALGYGWAECVHPDDSERCLEIHSSSFDGRQPFRMEYRLRHADGTFRWVYDSGTPRFSEAGEFLGYIGTCVDITDRKKSEEALRVALEEVSRLKNQLQEENIYLQEEINLEQNFGEIVGQSNALRYVLFKIEQVAPTETTVLITGETGTGKELVARAIHKASSRRERPLVKVNCAALSPSLIESEFFGHEKGAFTGASARKIGRFELADGATIFLDEIGELPTELQVKLLRVIQEGEFERLGSSRTIKADVRIIAATNRNLDLDVRKGLFREDLWYRLNVFPITVPALRERREDIPLLVEHFVRMFAKKHRKVLTSVAPNTLKTLRNYSWPGNVRELANVIERAVINSQGTVLRIVEDFAEPGTEKLAQTNKTLEELERDYIVRILNETGWRIEGRHGAARILGINPSTLRARMIKLGIQKPGSAFGISAGKDSG